jgi:hypothetical protein
MPKIAREITALLGAVGLWVYATGCGPSVVDLGARGGGFGALAAGAGGLAASGSGGASGGGTAGSGQVASGAAGAGAAAISGAGSGPSVAGAGGASPPAAVSDPAADPSRGCGTQPPPSNMISTIMASGSTANYFVDLATGYDRNRPYRLVMSFRGPATTMLAFRRALDLPTVVGADGIVVNVDIANGASTWDLQRDQQVFQELLGQLEASLCIDQRRVFVVGHATGAIFASHLACMVSGLRGFGSINGVTPSRPCLGGLAAWISQGNADMTVSLGQASRDFWAQQNHCNASMSAPVDPKPCLEYMGCEPGDPLRYCEYDGNGTMDVPSFAASGVWNFFKGL